MGVSFCSFSLYSSTTVGETSNCAPWTYPRKEDVSVKVTVGHTPALVTASVSSPRLTGGVDPFGGRGVGGPGVRGADKTSRKSSCRVRPGPLVQDPDFLVGVDGTLYVHPSVH